MTDSAQNKVIRGTYRDLDAFQIIEDGRVMVALDVPNHRMPEEYVPAAALTESALGEELRLVAEQRDAIAGECDRYRRALEEIVALRRHSAGWWQIASDALDQQQREESEGRLPKGESV